MNLTSLKDRQFDLLVIGGGINGAAIAWDAALRGLSVLLVEKNDFGGATSAAAFKIVHGGLRYLQYLDVPRVMRSAKEQMVLRRLAPHLLKPLPILVPCFGYGAKSKQFLGLGATLYDFVTCWKNSKVDLKCRLPGRQLFNAEQVLEVAPYLEKRGLTGGVVFHDAQLLSTEQLSLAVIRSAIAAGAVAVNYAEAEALDISEPGPDNVRVVQSVQIRSKRNGASVKVRARAIVNATGPWAEWLLKKLPESILNKTGSYRVTLSKGVQLALPQLIQNYGVAVESREDAGGKKLKRGNRSFFIVPWQSLSLVGTTEAVSVEDPDQFAITEDDIEGFLNDLRAAYPDKRLTRSDVLYAFGGLRPMRTSKDFSLNGDPSQLLQSDLIFDHNSMQHPFLNCRVENLFSVVGIKYTTFRALAEKTVNQLVRRFNWSEARACQTQRTRLSGTNYGTLSSLDGELRTLFPTLAPRSRAHLIAHYGSNALQLAEAISQNEKLGRQISSSAPTLWAEIDHACLDDSVLHLDDIIFRRTSLGTTTQLDSATLRAVGFAVGQKLEWSEKRLGEELARIERPEQIHPMARTG